MTEPLALRARSAPQLLDTLFAVARSNAADLFTLSVLFLLPVHAFRLLGAFAGTASALSRLSPELYLATAWWNWWSALSVTSAVVATCQLSLDGETGVRRALEGMRAGGWRLFTTVAAFTLVIDGLYALSSGDEPFGAFVAGVTFGVTLPWCAGAIPASVVERAGPVTALRRSLWLVQRSYWRVAVVIGVVWIVTRFADDQIVSFVFKLTDRSAISSVVDVAVDGLLYPLRGIALALVYLDCRVRREGFDVELLMRKR